MGHKRVEDSGRKKSLNKEEIRDMRRGSERGQRREGGEVTGGEKRRGRGGGVKTTR